MFAPTISSLAKKISSAATLICSSRSDQLGISQSVVRRSQSAIQRMPNMAGVAAERAASWAPSTR